MALKGPLASMGQTRKGRPKREAPQCKGGHLDPLWASQPGQAMRGGDLGFGGGARPSLGRPPLPPLQPPASLGGGAKPAPLPLYKEPPRERRAYTLAFGCLLLSL